MHDGLSMGLASFLIEAQMIVPGRCSTGEAVRREHANSLTLISPQPPGAVLWPETTAEVAALVRAAGCYKVPLIGFGAGTSLEGHVNAPRGGAAIDFSKMNNVLEIRPGDLDCTVQAGCTLHRLNADLRATGLFFPVDPGADHATLGGMAATRASGTTTVRYGSMRDNVVNIKAVMASGEVIRTARRARKSAAGYDLTRLLIGSEGTLGLITELTLKLYGVPETILAASASFATIEGACRASTMAIQSGLAVARIEFLDAVQMQCVIANSGLELEARPTLFLEFHGTSAACRSDFEAFEEIAAGAGGHGIVSAAGEDGRRQLWKARHDAFWSVKTAWPGRGVVVADVAVPLSKLAEAVTETAADIQQNGLIAPIVGHIGDGNFHAIVVVDPSDPVEIACVEAFLERLVARALALDGTATGEHGIGQGKVRYMTAEHGPGLDIMRAIKRALDPMEILNPGKMF